MDDVTARCPDRKHSGQWGAPSDRNRGLMGYTEIENVNLDLR